MAAQRSTGWSTSATRLFLILLLGVSVIGKMLYQAQLEQRLWVDGEGVLRLTELLAMRRFGIGVPGLDVLSVGYPAAAHLTLLLLKADALWPIGVVQSVLYAVATWQLATAIARTRLAWATIPFALIVTLNPALTLSTVALSPDGLVASLAMLALALMVRDLLVAPDRRRPWRLLVGALLLGLATVALPVFALGALGMLVGWAVARGNREQAIWLGSASVAALMVLPLALLAGNQIANNSARVAVGADRQTFNFGSLAPNTVRDDNSRCGVTSIDLLSLDVPRWRCLTAWYQEESAEASQDAVHHAVGFWEPWAGPLHEPSLRDNPWGDLQPVHRWGDDDPRSILASPFAAAVSWLWMLGSVTAALAGMAGLRQLGEVEHALSTAIGWLVVGAWLVGSIVGADASSRLPVLAPLLLLQVAGWRYLVTRTTTASKDPFLPV